METFNTQYLIDHPEESERLLGRRVMVKTENGKDYKGVIKTIDPISGSVVLLQFNDEKPPKPINLKIITGHSIECIEVDGHQSDKQDCEITLREEEQMNENQITERKDKLIQWFTKNRIPVVQKDNQDLVVASILTLKPPYGKDDCISSNEMVIRRIQDLMGKMPT